MEEPMDFEISYPQPNFWPTNYIMSMDSVDLSSKCNNDEANKGYLPPIPPLVHDSPTRSGHTREATSSNVVSTSGSGVLCAVCSDQAAGRYFGAQICEACKSFFIRSTKKGQPTFRCINSQRCDVTPTSRLLCQYCRYQKCLEAGMCRKAKQPAKEPSPDRLPCKVCGDVSSGIHFGVYTCEGCKGFFRRSLKDGGSYTCSGKDPNECVITPTTRNMCRRCRFQKCITVGMSRAGIKLGRHQKYLNSQSAPGEGPDSSQSASQQDELPFQQQQLTTQASSAGNYLMDIKGAGGKGSHHPGYPHQSRDMYATQQQNLMVQTNFEQMKDFVVGHQNQHLEDFSMSSKMAATSDMLPSAGNNMDLYHTGSRIDQTFGSLVNNPGSNPDTSCSFIYPAPKATYIKSTTEPLPVKSSYPYPPKALYCKPGPSDALSTAVSQTLDIPNGMLELLNSPYDPYPKLMNRVTNRGFHTDPMLAGVTPESMYAPSADPQSTGLHPCDSPIKLEQQAQATDTNASYSVNQASGQQVLNSNKVSSSSSRASSPFTDYGDSSFDLDSLTSSSDANSSAPTAYQSQHIPKSTGSAGTSGSSLLMGNQWTSYRPPDVDTLSPPPTKALSPIEFVFKDKASKIPTNDHGGNTAGMVNVSTELPPASVESSESKKRKGKPTVKVSGNDWESQMPQLDQIYLEQIQNRMKVGCSDGEILSTESEAYLRKIDETIADLDRGSIMFELSQAYGKLFVNKSPSTKESGETKTTPEKMVDDNNIDGLKDLFKNRVVAVIGFIKNIPGFRALAMKDQMTLIRFGLFPINVILSGREPNDENSDLMILSSGRYRDNTSMKLMFNGVDKHLVGFFETYKQVQLDRIQASLLMAMAIFNPDLPSLVSKELILKRHWILRQILRQYCIEKCGNYKLFYSILSLVPQLFHIEYHHKQSIQHGLSSFSDISLPLLFAEINL